jgi:N-acetyl sugar amidotransferase
MRYCKTCLSTDLRPNGKFYEDGNCAPCHFHMEIGEVNWNKRLSNLMVLIASKKFPTNSNFDCIVGVSGGKDSTRQALWVRDRLKLKPLLVCVAYPPHQITDIGAHNLSNLIALGFTCITVAPAPRTSRDLTRKAFFKFGNVAKATEFALFSQVPRLAIDFNINLIFWGENPASQVGDFSAMGQSVFDGNSLRNMNTLSAGGLSWIEEEVRHEALTKNYTYPNLSMFNENGIQIIFLGPAWNDWSMFVNSKFAALEGLTIRHKDVLNTGDILRTSMLDEDFSNINMMIKYYKFGFGRTTDFCNEMIRMGRISRSEAIHIVQKSDGVCSDEIIDSFCKYIEITTRKFWETVNFYCNTNLFEISENARPRPRFRVGEDLAT